MVILDRFYQIRERKTSTVSSFWKVAHTFACVVSAVCAFLTSFTFGRILDDFRYNCVLNAQIVFDNDTFLNKTGDGYVNPHRAIDLLSTMWGPSSDCNFAQFTPLVIMISAIMWGTYFVVMSKGGSGYSTDLLGKPWTIIYPCIFFTTIFFITYVISTLRLKQGIQGFCNQFQPELNNTGCTQEIDIYTSQFKSGSRAVFFLEFYANMLVTTTASDIGCWSWVFQLLLCVARIFCVADFDIQFVTIMTKEEEHVESIVEFEDLEDIDEVSEV